MLRAFLCHSTPQTINPARGGVIMGQGSGVRGQAVMASIRYSSISQLIHPDSKASGSGSPDCQEII